ncbi:MAG: transposase family protein [Caulobacteraceae bacterium]
MLKLRDVLSRWDADELSQIEAAELLGMHERADRRLGRRSGRAVSEAETAEVERSYLERYMGFTAKHFHEYLAASHGFGRSYSWTKGFLQDRGLLARAPRRGAHRRKRPRRPMVGMMLHQDASKHVWIEGLGALDLVVTMDDATSDIYSIILVEEEGTMSTFAGLIETIAAKGCSGVSDLLCKRHRGSCFPLS